MTPPTLLEATHELLTGDEEDGDGGVADVLDNPDPDEPGEGLGNDLAHDADAGLIGGWGQEGCRFDWEEEPGVGLGKILESELDLACRQVGLGCGHWACR